MPKTLTERLLAKTRRDENGCLVWTGAPRGRDRLYGQITNEVGREEYVHRVSYRLFVGPIPDGHQVDHVRARGCLSTLCIEPTHLEPVTQKINIQRSAVSGAHTMTHGICPHGHVQTPENTYARRNGTRECRPCSLRRSRERYLRTQQKETL